MEVLSAQLRPTGFVGAYLHGSLAGGGWCPPKSDVDLLIVVEDRLDPGARERLGLTWVDIVASRPTLGLLELTVVRRSAGGAGRFPMPVEAAFREADVERVLAGAAGFRAPDPDPELAIHVRNLLESGVVLEGPAVDEVFAPVPEAAFLRAVRDDVDWILTAENVLESPVYAVLNLCRALWVRHRPGERSTPGKVEAGRWAVGMLPPDLRRVALDAVDAHRDSRWVAPEHRRTAGRVWDAGALLDFRDELRRRLASGDGGPEAGGEPGHPEAASE